MEELRLVLGRNVNRDRVEAWEKILIVDIIVFSSFPRRITRSSITISVRTADPLTSLAR